jgi:MFS family permease
MWGIVLSCFAAVENYSGAIAIRFFLGVFEAAVTPGFALFTSQWYTKKEQGFRTGIWFSFNGFAQIFGGLVAYGIAVGARKHGTLMEPWKIVFLVTGLLTTAVGFLFLWIMPDNQLNCRWLSKEDQILAIERIRMNGQGVGNKLYQLKEALLDPMAWAFFFYALVADIPNGGLSNFFSQLIVGFGYTPEESLLYGTPGGAVEIVALIGCGWLGDKYLPPLPSISPKTNKAQTRLPHPRLHVRHVSRPPRDDPHCRAPPLQQQRPPRRLLPDASQPHPLRCHPQPHLQQRRRLHQEDHRRGHVPHRVLHRKHHR